MIILKTQRLILSKISEDDAGFIYELVNDPDWLRYIGDKDIHDLKDARSYIKNVSMVSYEQHGYGPYLVRLKEGKIRIGISGLFKRDYLDHPDVGFAFLPAYRNKGYATESAAAVLNYGYASLNLTKILAITSRDNDSSARVLEKIGLQFQKIIKTSKDDPGSKLYVLNRNER